ncbi:MAG: glycosyltransferase family 2 protein, partial [Oscillospiraceae bacterium]
HKGLEPFRDVFCGYELLAYLSVRATRLGLRACEVPVSRRYPKTGKTPTKISPVRGNASLLKVLIKTLKGDYNPK